MAIHSGHCFSAEVEQGYADLATAGDFSVASVFLAPSSSSLGTSSVPGPIVTFFMQSSAEWFNPEI